MTKSYIKHIHSIHPSLRPKNIHIPHNMDRARVGRDCIEAMEEVALSIFTDCTNVGVPFQEALCAIYMSGLHHGSELQKEISNDE